MEVIIGCVGPYTARLPHGINGDIFATVEHVERVHRGIVLVDGFDEEEEYFDDMDMNEIIVSAEQIRDKATEPTVVVLCGIKEDKISFICMANKAAVAAGCNAGKVIKGIAPIAGGSGGGKPDMAQGGGKEANKIDEKKQENENADEDVGEQVENKTETIKTEPAEASEGHTHSYVAEVVNATCTADGYTLNTCECGDNYEEPGEPMVPHVDTNLDITCDFEGCTKRILPAADSKVSLFTANHMTIVSLSSNYYVEGVITEITDAKNGIFIIADEEGNSILVRLPKNAEGVSYAIIFSNLLVPLIEKITVPRAFGVEKNKKKEAA